MMFKVQTMTRSFLYVVVALLGGACESGVNQPFMQPDSGGDTDAGGLPVPDLSRGDGPLLSSLDLAGEDVVGPTITIVSPLAGQFVGGIIDIEADIEDASGVDDSSVIAVFGGNLSKGVKLNRVSLSMPRFQGVFDVGQLGTHYVLPTLSVRADDVHGLHSEVGEEIVVDNVAPAISLDPPGVYVSTLLPTGIRQCSQISNRVGSDAANDLDVVPQIVTLRARVQDRGNFAPGLAVVRVSVVADGSVYLYGIPTANGPLAVDSDGDGVCDEVNPELVLTANISASNQGVAVQMASIEPGGNPDLQPFPTPSPLLDRPRAAVDRHPHRHSTDALVHGGGLVGALAGHQLHLGAPAGHLDPSAGSARCRETAWDSSSTASTACRRGPRASWWWRATTPAIATSRRRCGCASTAAATSVTAGRRRRPPPASAPSTRWRRRPAPPPAPCRRPFRRRAPAWSRA